MSQHALPITLSLPEDGPGMAEVRQAARQLGITFDMFVSRAVVLLAEETLRDAASPGVQATLEVAAPDEDGRPRRGGAAAG